MGQAQKCTLGKFAICPDVDGREPYIRGKDRLSEEQGFHGTFYAVADI